MLAYTSTVYSINPPEPDRSYVLIEVSEETLFWVDRNTEDRVGAVYKRHAEFGLEISSPLVVTHCYACTDLPSHSG